MEIKGYIFDYGGTIDTAGCHWGKMLWHAYERQHVPVAEEQFREAYVYAERTLGKNPIIQPDYTFRKTLEVKLRIEFDYLLDNGYLNMGNFSTTSLRTAVLNDLYEQVKAETSRSRGVLMTLRENYPMVLVSNFYGNVEVVLNEFQLDGLFQSVVESAVVGVRKPDPRIFELGVEALKMRPEEVAVVGDSIKKDMIPAHQVGCQTIWVKGEGWTEEPENVFVPDRTIRCLADLV